MSDAAPLDVRQIAIETIVIPERLRPVDDAWVQVITASVATNGLQEPVLVNVPDAMRVPDFPDAVELVAGAHRLAAARALGWVSIPARLIAVDRKKARLIEIDENLMRRELSALDRAIFLAERQSVWEDLYPDTKRGVRGGKIRQKTATDMLSFSHEAANKTGLSPRTVRRAVALARSFDAETIEKLRASPISDNAAQLRAISRLGGATRSSAVDALATGRARSLKEALGGGSKPAPDGFKALLNAWTRAGAKERKRFLIQIGAEIKVSGEASSRSPEKEAPAGADPLAKPTPAGASPSEKRGK